jgi:hypothetical protein
MPRDRRCGGESARFEIVDHKVSPPKRMIVRPAVAHIT